MAESSPQVSSGVTTELSKDLKELRDLLLAPEQTRIERLQERLDNPTLHAQDVSRVLPDAIVLRRTSDGALAQALTPVVEEALSTSVRKSPRVIVDAISPIMGPAIRRSIMQTLQGMVQTLNQTLEQSMSAKGLRWRIEAWKTGRPFAEVVLLHTLLYRVEQVFLIHRETGLPLHHVSAPVAAVQDKQLVAGMLTAIQQFVRDAFGAGHDETLDQFQVGDYTVWIEQGPRAFLAAVMRGAPPLTFRRVLRESLDQIHLRNQEEFTRFDGDPALFDAAHDTLESCLLSQQSIASQQSRSSASWILGTVLLLGMVMWGWFSYQEAQRWADFLIRARGEPGLVITQAESTLSGYRIDGLRDPLAKDPGELLKESGVNPEAVTALWVPYYALDPQLIVKRAGMILHPPETVTLSMTGEILTASGSAVEEWVREARRVAVLIPGVSVFEDRELRTVSPDELVRRINSTIIHFTAGSSMIEAEEQNAVKSVIAALRDLDLAAGQSQKQVLLSIVGSTDASGPAALNAQLGPARARSVIAAFGGERFGEVTRIADATGVPGMAMHRSLAGRSMEQRSVFLHVTVGPAENVQATRP